MASNGAGIVKVQNAGELTPKGRAARDRIVAAAADLMFDAHFLNALNLV
jgi:hypothetical protein